MFAGGSAGENAAQDGHVIVLDPQDIGWHHFHKSFLAATGVDLNQYRSAQIRRRVASIATAAGESFTSLAERLDASPVLAAVALHQIAIHTTQLFRDQHAWLELRENWLSELAQSGGEFRAWCAGCANGAEAYSLASLMESLSIPGRILATDIDSIILEQAVKGRFTNAQGKHVKSLLPAIHFEKRFDGYQAKPSLGRRISFREHNVLNDPIDLGFDLISCRNVAIYLQESACDILYRNLYRSLRSGGVLFLGASERIFRLEEYGFKSLSSCLYQKLP